MSTIPGIKFGRDGSEIGLPNRGEEKVNEGLLATLAPGCVFVNNDEVPAGGFTLEEGASFASIAHRVESNYRDVVKGGYSVEIIRDGYCTEALVKPDRTGRLTLEIQDSYKMFDSALMPEGISWDVDAMSLIGALSQVRGSLVVLSQDVLMLVMTGLSSKDYTMSGLEEGQKLEGWELVDLFAYKDRGEENFSFFHSDKEVTLNIAAGKNKEGKNILMSNLTYITECRNVVTHKLPDLINHSM